MSGGLHSDREEMLAAVGDLQKRQRTQTQRKTEMFGSILITFVDDAHIPW